MPGPAPDPFPRLDALPAPQRRLWRELGATPPQFVLYGGTAIALRLGHRSSYDFDFFSTSRFDSQRLLAEIPYIGGATVLDQDDRTLVCSVDREGPVQVSFFGSLALRRVRDPDRLTSPVLRVASLLDLAATKAQVVQARSSARDYLDLDALIRRAVRLEEALGAAAAVFGPSFNPLLTLKALTFFGDGDLATVAGSVRRRLVAAVRAVNPDRLPRFAAKPGVSGEASS